MRKKILVMEDDKSRREQIIKALSSLYTVVGPTRLAEVNGFLQSHLLATYDLVILDYFYSLWNTANPPLYGPAIYATFNDQRKAIIQQRGAFTEFILYTAYPDNAEVKHLARQEKGTVIVPSHTTGPIELFTIVRQLIGIGDTNGE